MSSLLDVVGFAMPVGHPSGNVFSTIRNTDLNL